jgi:hypothetical protein
VVRIGVAVVNQLRCRCSAQPGGRQRAQPTSDLGVPRDRSDRCCDADAHRCCRCGRAGVQRLMQSRFQRVTQSGPISAFRILALSRNSFMRCV